MTKFFITRIYFYYIFKIIIALLIGLGSIIDIECLDAFEFCVRGTLVYFFLRIFATVCATATILGQAAQAAPPFRRRSSSFGSAANEREFWPAEELLLANLKFLFTGHAASLL